jgi:formylglycine-generating enzyme required for sulfatase activity
MHHRRHTMSRRGFFRSLGFGAGSALLSACGAYRAADTTSGVAAIASPAPAIPLAPPAAAIAPLAEPTMIRIPGGEYLLGADDGPSDAQPAHTVRLEPFLIDQYEVTNAQYVLFLNALGVQLLADAPAGQVTARSFHPDDAARFLEGGEGDEDPALLIALDDSHCRIGIADGRFAVLAGYEDHPVAETSWRGADAYARWRGARLPTEAEWEAAARGATGRLYPWGDTPPTPEHAVYGRGSGETASVGVHRLGATPEGVHDLAGNLAEWTSTLYRPYPYRADDGREDPNGDGERVTRGGDHVYDSSPETLTAIHRRGFSRAPARGHRHIGFRCARAG